jgi:uncharacterized membrane protein YkvA (DUF1232 family)
MGEDRRPITVRPDDTNVLVAWFQDLVRQARLAWRLFWDKRVSFWTKLIPPATLAYILSPIDILTDVAPGLGQLDDIAVLLLGTKLFIELAPPDVVREHLIALGARIKEWRVVEEEQGAPPDVIEGEYTLAAPETQEAEEEGKETETPPVL